MARGGARSGAGRPAGSSNKRTKAIKAITDRAMAEGITPLEVMLMAMRKHLEGTTPDYDAAASVAKDAAPYMHPRLSSIDANHSGEVGVVVEIVRFGEDAK